MSNKTRIAKLARKIVRKDRKAMMRKFAADVLALPFKDRFKIGINIIFNRIIFKEHKKPHENPTR